jgi:DNA-damage-inducible protein J
MVISCEINKDEVITMASTIQVRVDDEMKMKADALFKDLGTDTTSAIRMFLAQSIMQNGIPFEVKRVPDTEVNPFQPMSEEELYAKLATSRQHAAEGKARDANDVVSDMRTKYGL